MKRKKAPPSGISKPKSRPKKYGGKLQPILKARKLGILSLGVKEGPQKRAFCFYGIAYKIAIFEQTKNFTSCKTTKNS
jgi:hypothetical protein